MCEALLHYFLNDMSLVLHIYVLLEDFIIGVQSSQFIVFVG